MTDAEIIKQCLDAGWCIVPSGHSGWAPPICSRVYRFSCRHPETFDSTENEVFIGDGIWIESEAGVVGRWDTATYETLEAALKEGLKDLPVLK